MSLRSWLSGIFAATPPKRAQGGRTSLAQSRVLDVTRKVTMRQRAEMRTYGPIRTALEQYTQPILGADIALTVEDSDAITEDLQRDLETTGRLLIERALLALEYGWSPMEVVWNPSDWSVAELRCPDPLTVKPVFENGRLAGIEQTTTGVRLTNDGWLDHLVTIYQSEHGEVPGHALIDRAEYHYRAHRLLTRMLAVNAKNVALPPIIVRHPEAVDGSGDANASRALAVGKKVDQSDDRAVIELPQPYTADDARWEIEYVEASQGASSLIELEARWLSRLYLSLGVPSEMLVNESSRGTQARTASVIDTFIGRLDYIAQHVVEPPLQRLMQAICDYRHGPGHTVTVDIASLDHRRRDSARDLIVTGIQSRNGLAGLSDQGIDIEALCAQAGIPYSPELVEDEPGLDTGQLAAHERMHFSAADGRSRDIERWAKKALPTLRTIIGGPRGERGGLLKGLEAAYYAATQSGDPVRWEPDTSALRRLAKDLQAEARKQAVRYFQDSELTGYESVMSRADSWCDEQVIIRTERLIQTMRDRATDHARAAYGLPSIQGAAERYWTSYALPRFKGDVLGYWTQLSAALLGHYRSAPVAYAQSQ